MNLIKKYFVTHLAHCGDVKVANKQNKVTDVQVSGHL